MKNTNDNSVPHIIISFSGKESTTEAYRIHLDSFESAMQLIAKTGTKEQKSEARVTLLSLLAVVDNAIFVDQYPKLSRVVKDKEETNLKKETVTTPWTLDLSGNTVATQDRRKTKREEA